MSDQGACFNKHVRLLKPAEYSRVFRKPIRSNDRLFTILAVKNGMSHARLGLAISKKNARRAVDRNRIKRLVRESFRLNLNKLAALDLVVMARPETKQAENRQIIHSLQQHWDRLNRQCEKSS